MMIRERIANIIIGDRGNEPERHLVDLPRQNPITGRKIANGEHAEMICPFNIEELLQEPSEKKSDDRRLFLLG